MEGMNVTAIWALMLGAASAIVLLANAAEKIIKAYKASKAPSDKQDARLDALEAWQKDVDRKLLRDNDHLLSIDEGNRVTQRAILALLDHGIDGNNVKQMQEAKAELQEYLISR